MSTANRYTGLVDRYRDRLPVSATTPAISLGEGNTPLIKLANIPRLIGKNVEIYVKYEGLNPTGSFKDRGMTMAVTKAVEAGSKAIICASTGNTSAAAAAYAARAGIISRRIRHERRALCQQSDVSIRSGCLRSYTTYVPARYRYTPRHRRYSWPLPNRPWSGHYPHATNVCRTDCPRRRSD